MRDSGTAALAAFVAGALLTSVCETARAGELNAGAAVKRLEATDEMVIGGGIGPGRAALGKKG